MIALARLGLVAVALVAAASCTPRAQGTSGSSSTGSEKPKAVLDAGASSEGTWTHPSLKMSFAYPAQMTLAERADGATLTSAVLDKALDASIDGDDAQAVFSIEVAVRAGKLLDVMAGNAALDLRALFPSGKEASFKEQKGLAETLKVAGRTAYRVHTGSHERFQDMTYAQLDRGTLEIVCHYLDVRDAKVTLAEQRKACERVLSTISL